MVYQISVFLENKPNRLYDLTKALESAKVNFRAAMIAEAGEFGIIRCIVDDPDRAYEALNSRGFTVKKTHVVGVAVQDVPGSLSEIARLLGSQNINIQYLYAFSVAGTNTAFLILKTDDIERSQAVLGDSPGLKIISHDDINNL
jgi:hypothetical protein